jgi:hypothetical protein
MENWKTAIRVEVVPGWEQSMQDAIEFYVGGKCRVSYQRGSATVPNAGRVAVITNPGYYVNIGA